ATVDDDAGEGLARPGSGRDQLSGARRVALLERDAGTLQRETQRAPLDGAVERQQHVVGDGRGRGLDGLAVIGAGAPQAYGGREGGAAARRAADDDVAAH